jgi:hypothetical protein
MQLISGVLSPSRLDPGTDSQADASRRTVLVRKPYGDEWDVLWIGHCGVEYPSRTLVSHHDDPHSMLWGSLTSQFNGYYEVQSTNLQQSQQLLDNVAPLSTYAFAVTR